VQPAPASKLNGRSELVRETGTSTYCGTGRVAPQKHLSPLGPPSLRCASKPVSPVSVSTTDMSSRVQASSADRSIAVAAVPAAADAVAPVPAVAAPGPPVA